MTNDTTITTSKNNILNENNLGSIYIFTAGFLWGFIGLFVKQIEACGASASMISFLRVAFSCGILLAICIWKFGVKSLIVDRKTLFVCALLGIICHGIYNLFYSYAVTKAGVAISAVLLDIAPIVTFLFSAVLFHEKITGKKIIAAIVNVIGCILAVTNGSLSLAGLSLIGILFGIGAGVCYSLTAIIGKFSTNRTNSYVVSLYSYLFASITLGLFSHPFSGGSINSGILFWSFLYALIPTAIAYIFYYNGVNLIHESSRVPVIASVEVVVACITGVAFYHEAIGLYGTVGICLVLLSIIILNRKKLN